MQEKRHSLLGLPKVRSMAVDRGNLASCAFLLAGSRLYAQAVSGTILGTVTDPGGAVVAERSGHHRPYRPAAPCNYVTNESGNFTEPNLPPGAYTVTVTAQGFKRNCARTSRC